MVGCGTEDVRFTARGYSPSVQYCSSFHRAEFDIRDWSQTTEDIFARSLTAARGGGAGARSAAYPALWIVLSGIGESIIGCVGWNWWASGDIRNALHVSIAYLASMQFASPVAHLSGVQQVMHKVVSLTMLLKIQADLLAVPLGCMKRRQLLIPGDVYVCLGAEGVW